MKYVDWRDHRSAPEKREAPVVPTSCPVCRSTSVTTMAKAPDAESYWRCTACGEVWNHARRQASRNR